jgi:structural maintenance of chromosome 4
MSLEQDEQSKKQAENLIQDSDTKIKTKKREIAEHEANLEKEEKVLEGIRDSLKGSCFHPLTHIQHHS